MIAIDRDGARNGYDLELTRVGNAAHDRDAIVRGGADAALVAGILHDGQVTVALLKDAMRATGLSVREAA